MRYSSIDPFVQCSYYSDTQTVVREFRYYPSSMSWLTKCQDTDNLRRYVTQVIDKHYRFDLDDTYAFKVEATAQGLATGTLTIQVKMPEWRYLEYKSQG